MYIANPIAFGVFIGVVSTIVVEAVTLFVWAVNNTKGKK